MANDVLKDLFIKYKLNYDKDNPNSKSNDVYKHKHYTIITRQGIQKIEKEAGITCTMEIVPGVSTPTNITIRGVGYLPDGKNYTTFASASPDTSNNNYYAEMAEKRCRSRLVLTLAGLYELGVYGEDEATAFSDTVKAVRESSQETESKPLTQKEFKKAVFKA